jgi:D-glucosaminate-6-phosphate ammonia-lyase
MNIYEELGVRPVVNAMGPRTLLGGNTPAPAVRALMDEAEEYYADMAELSARAGEKIAQLLDIEAAIVTSGTASALVLGASACMTGKDTAKIEQLPDTTGMPCEFIIQRGLRLKYDRCMTLSGGKLVEVGDEEGTRPEHIEEAIGPNTAGIHYFVQSRAGVVPLEQVIQIGAHDIPIVVDAAGCVYPPELLSKYVKMGADLVAYGAKYYGSVNASGLLTGRKDLVEAAAMHSFVSFESTEIRALGRPMKMERQGIIAAYAALKEWLSMDHEARFAACEARIDATHQELKDVPNIELVDPRRSRTDLWIRVDAEKLGKTAVDVVDELREGNPSIWVQDGDEHHFRLYFGVLPEGQESIIVERLKEILK